MPAVTVPCSPSGEPMAITGSPTASLSESPRLATVSWSLGTLITARSLTGSRPTILAFAVASSLKVTTIDASAVAGGRRDDVVVRQDVALLVDHDAGADPELVRRLCTAIDTTAGPTRLAMSATERG